MTGLKKLLSASAICLAVASGYVQTGNARPAQGGQPAQLAQGRKVYLDHCASCHGVEAKGNGTIAPLLKKKPTDLTRIPKVDGKFPAERVRAAIMGDSVLAIHGDKEMPVWGGILKEAEVASLLQYLESIQRQVALPVK